MAKKSEGLSITEIGFNLKYNIKRSTKSLPKNYLVLAIIKTKSYSKLTSAFLDLFVNDEKREGIYLTTNKTYDKVKFLVEKNKVKMDWEKVLFIDCMGSGIKGEKTERVISAPPQNLTDLNIMIDSILKKNEDISFIILDSLSTFFIYNSPKEIEKFIRSVIRKLNDHKVKGVFVTTKTRSNESIIEEISLFFDETLSMTI